MRPRIFFTASLLFSVIFSLSGQTERKLLFSIGEDEAPVFDESRLFAGNSGSVSMVTMNNEGKYFLYVNGEKKGPFEDAFSTGFESGEEGQDMYSSIYSSDTAGDASGLVSYDSDGKQLIRSGDRTLGPFELILNVFADYNGKFLMAVVSENMKYSMVSSTGTTIALEGAPYFMSQSPDGSRVMLVTVNDSDPALDYMNRDFSNLSQDELIKITEEIEEKRKNAPPPEAYVYFSDGKKFGPYPKDPVFEGNPGFCKTGGNNWILLVENELYVNGTVTARLEDDYVSTGDIWLSRDGKRFAILSYDNIKFSDGETFNYPLKISAREQDGKTVFSWLSLENETEVVLYTKAL